MAIQPGIAPSMRTSTRLPLHRGAEPIREGAPIAISYAPSSLNIGARQAPVGGAGRSTMNDTIKLPEDCTDMREVRRGVDATDRELMKLLERRFGYMRAAARIKTDRNVVRDEARKQEVIENARADAEDRRLPFERIASIWDALVETSIDYELDTWDRLRRTD
ncbi:chorismate mutase [Qipengyuania flava]|uniref:chorismate mutase n=1 Tax=Qipengyuania flava TaxID=192812 RepID=UPI00384DDDB5